MLLEKLTINVGESTTMYIEVYTAAIDESELKYGDCRWDEDGKMFLWYGLDDDASLSGWVNSPWSMTDYSSAMLNLTFTSREDPAGVVYRIMNNDIDFDEKQYKLKDVEPNNG